MASKLIHSNDGVKVSCKLDYAREAYDLRVAFFDRIPFQYSHGVLSQLVKKRHNMG